MHFSRQIILGVTVCGALAVAGFAQGSRGTVTKPSPDVVLDPALFDARQLILKFREGSGIRLRDGQWTRPVASVVGAPRWPEVVAALRGAAVSRLMERTEADLDRERRQLLARLPEGLDPPADLNLYYRVELESEAAGRALCAKLNRFALVETCFVDHRAGIEADPNDIPPVTPLYRSRQNYWDAPPTGIDIRRSHAIPGARGEQLQILDIETGLIVDHEDVPRAIAANVIGVNSRPTDHGLAVAGEMVSARNGYGVTGGVYLARYKFHSHQGRNWASSVSVATSNSQPGDIIVLEVQLPWPSTGRPVPMENRQDVFDAVRTATMRGIHVIAAAGNGYQDLDSAIYNRVFDRTFRDSGAVLVGATEGSQLQRASFSNHGAIVDANGWGRNVVTTGYTDLFYPNGDRRQRYTARFGGTSSATPIVTSAAAALLSAARQQNRQTLTPAQLRSRLRNNGTAVPGGKIGVRPDLKKLLATIGLPRGLSSYQQVRIGRPLTLDVGGSAGHSFALFVAGGAGETVLPFGRLLLDTNSMALATQGTIPGSGTRSLTFAVPNDAALVSLEVHWQAARFARPSALDLTSSVATFFER